jgi:hypothetical protein
MLNLLLEILLLFFLHELHPGQAFKLPEDKTNHYYIYVATVKARDGKEYVVAHHAWKKENGKDTVEPVPSILRSITPQTQVRLVKGK